VKAYFDSSVLVSALLASHPRHTESFAWLERVHRREVRGVVAAHGLAETWSTLTGMPLHPPLGAHDALRLVQEAVDGRFRVVEAKRRDYASLLQAAARLDIRGGSIYDALHVAMARKCRADVVLTLDLRDFRRVAPDLGRRIREP
jgi:predicted nucleic acid-binding protein